MKGNFGATLCGAFAGNQREDKTMVEAVFQEEFTNFRGWTNALENIQNDDVNNLFSQAPGAWKTEHVHALYIACWIFHPVEKGTYMLQIPQEHKKNVEDAYKLMLKDEKLTKRPSSHLSGEGASASQGWGFLKGYGELLVQFEDEGSGRSYLMLKAEGHALVSGINRKAIESTVKHGLAWINKIRTGEGNQANAALHGIAVAGQNQNVEARAAENYSKSYEKLLNKLKLKGKKVSVAETITELLKKVDYSGRFPVDWNADTHTLGRLMKGKANGGQNYIMALRNNKAKLKAKGINFDDIEKELTDLADRMIGTSAGHSQQYFNEVRVTGKELQDALETFHKRLVTG